MIEKRYERSWILFVFGTKAVSFRCVSCFFVFAAVGRSTIHTMMLKIYSAALVVVEIPAILGLLRGQPLSALSPWFKGGAVDSPEFSAVYAAWLTLLCICRTMVIGYPKSRGVLFNAASVHAVEIPLYMYLLSRMANPSWAEYGVMGAILVNPFFFLQAALRSKQ